MTAAGCGSDWGRGPMWTLSIIDYLPTPAGSLPFGIDRIVDSGNIESESNNDEDDEFDTSEARQTRIDPFRSEHPAMRQLADDTRLDLSDAVIDRRFEFFDGTGSENLSVLIRLNNGKPLAAENFIGRGRVIVQAVPMRLQWSDLARTQAFVVMVRDWIDYLAEPRATKLNLQPGEPIEMRLAIPEEAAESNGAFEAPIAMLTTPQGDAIELTAHRRDNGYEYRSSRTRLPGDYQLEIGLAEQVVPFHVHRSAKESDLVGTRW